MDITARVAQLWCLPKHENKVMDTDFAESIIALVTEAHDAGVAEGEAKFKASAAMAKASAAWDKAYAAWAKAYAAMAKASAARGKVIYSWLREQEAALGGGEGL